MFCSYLVEHRVATPIFFEDCFLLKTKNTRNLRNCQSQTFLMAQFYKQLLQKKIFKNLMLVFIKNFLLFPIWNLKAILTKHNFSSKMTKEEKTHKEKDFT